MCHDRWTRYSQEALQGRWLRDLSAKPATERPEPSKPVAAPPRSETLTMPRPLVAGAER
jgi:hypothetical protein